MAGDSSDINGNYERFYAARAAKRVYPTEFVVRTFLASYPGLRMPKPKASQRVLDVGFGDGRNTVFLCEQGFAVSGIEITQGIVDQGRARLDALGHRAELRVGRNSRIPFEAEYFDYVLACHSCYYCDEGESLSDNLSEYARVMRPGAFLAASVACRTSYIFEGATECTDGTLMIRSDPYGNRNGYRLHAFKDTAEIQAYFARWFANFSFGYACNDYYGISERVFWVVCQKKGHDE